MVINMIFKQMGGLKDLAMGNKSSIIKGVVFGKHMVEQMKDKKEGLTKADKMAIMKQKIKTKKIIMKHHLSDMKNKNKEDKEI